MKKKLKIGFIGLGKLGGPVAGIFHAISGHEVMGYDVRDTGPHAFPLAKSIEELARDKDVIFIFVQTPHDPAYDGSAPTAHLPAKDFDYSHVINVLKSLKGHVHEDTIVILSSTVLPGTINKHFTGDIRPKRFVYNPYLVAMGSIRDDLVFPEMMIFGIGDTRDLNLVATLDDIYSPFVSCDRHFIGTYEEAEAIKVFYNVFISAKVGIANMIQDVAMRTGNMNSCYVAQALAQSTKRITSERYLRPGMGDGGPCFVPGTLVMTEHGVKPIESIRPGDRVLSENGVLQSVIRQWKTHYQGPVIHIKSDGFPEVTATPNHGFFAADDLRETYSTKNAKGRPVTKRRTGVKAKNLVSAIREVRADQLQIKSQYILQLTAKQDERQVVPDYATSDYMAIAGYYLSEGSIEPGKKGRPYRIKISLNVDEELTLAADVIDLFKRLGPNKTSSNKKGNSLTLRTCNGPLAEKLASDFGRGSANKIIPSWILFGPEHLGRQLMRGLWRGDGQCTRGGDGRFDLGSVSTGIAYGTALILQRLGISATLSIRPEWIANDGVHHKQSYTVAVSNFTSIVGAEEIFGLRTKRRTQVKKYDTRFVKDGLRYCPIKMTGTSFYEGPVYNLQVKNTHSYALFHGLWVKNCHPRDLIALRYLSEDLNLGYDLFGAINKARDTQALNMAHFLRDLGLPVVIVGKSYKPGVPYTDGSYSTLVGSFLRDVRYVLTPENGACEVAEMKEVCTYLMAHASYPEGFIETLEARMASGSIIVDPWHRPFLVDEDRMAKRNIKIVHYGNTSEISPFQAEKIQPVRAIQDVPATP